MPGSPVTIPAPELPPGPRHALMVATTTYNDPELRRLRAPARDAANLTKVLASPETGGFTVTSVINKPTRAIRLAVEDFLADRGTQDLVLVYLSCHGLKDASNTLFFAARDTIKGRLDATAIDSPWIERLLGKCRARRQILILDCCFSGAFGEHKGDGDLGLRNRFAGRGRYVLTASNATEYSYEGVPIEGAVTTGSVFTSALVTGLRTGAADTDHDGRITVEEAYTYTFERVRATGAAQTPQLSAHHVEGAIVLARSPAGRVLDRPELPDSLRVLLESPYSDARVVGAGELGTWLASGDPARELVAREKLREIADTDNPQVAGAARALLGSGRAGGAAQGPAAKAGTGQSEIKADSGQSAAAPDRARVPERGRRAASGKAAPGSGAALAPERKPGTSPLRSEKTPAADQTAPAPGSGAALAPERKPGTGPLRSAARQKPAAAGQKAPAASPKAPAARPKAPAASKKTPAAGQVTRRPARPTSPGPGAARHTHIPSRQLSAFTVPAPGINTLAFSPDGKMLATGADSADAAVLLWDPLTGQRLRTLKIDAKPTVDADLPFYGSNSWIEFSPDGRRLASSGPIFNRIWLWDPATGRAQREIPLRGLAATAGFSPDGRQLAVANTNGTVCWYDPATGQQRSLVRLVWPRGKAIEAVKRAVSGGRTQTAYSSMTFSPGLGALASTSDDGTVRVWNPATGEQRGAFQMRPASPTTLGERTFLLGGPVLQGFSPDGNLLALSDRGSGDLRVAGGVEWRDVATGVLRHRVGLLSAAAAFSPDGSMIATIEPGEIQLWDVATGQKLSVLAPQPTSGTGNSISCMAFGPRGDMLAAAGSSLTFEQLKLVVKGDASVRVWV